MTVRFLHTADLHLGSPLKAIGGESNEIREALADATYRAFARTVDLAIDQSVDFVVIAGDLYDRESRSVRANQFVVDHFNRLAEGDIPVYLCYGNHDPLGDRAELLELPDNVHAFGHEEAEFAEYPLDGPVEARVFGQSYRTSAESRPFYEDYTPPDATVPNIGLLHTGLDPEADRYVPCSEGDLRGMDEIHYWALGHIHQQRIQAGRPTIAYPGIPQGRDVTEPAVGGSLLVELTTDDEPSLEFFPTSPIVWHDETLDVASIEAELANLTEVERHLSDVAENLLVVDGTAYLPDLPVSVDANGWAPEGHICRFTLTGRGSVHEVLQSEDEAGAFLAERLRREFERESPFIWTESVRDRVGEPLPDLDELRERDPVINRFLDLVAELREDEAVRDELRDRAGDIWYESSDHEEERETELPLTEDTLDELLDRAESRVVEELIQRREYVDS